MPKASGLLWSGVQNCTSLAGKYKSQDAPLLVGAQGLTGGAKAALIWERFGGTTLPFPKRRIPAATLLMAWVARCARNDNSIVRMTDSLRMTAKGGC